MSSRVPSGFDAIFDSVVNVNIMFIPGLCIL